jgi:hypothetical protein
MQRRRLVANAAGNCSVELIQYKSARPDEPFGRATQPKFNQGVKAGNQKTETNNQQ